MTQYLSEGAQTLQVQSTLTIRTVTHCSLDRTEISGEQPHQRFSKQSCWKNTREHSRLDRAGECVMAPRDRRRQMRVVPNMLTGKQPSRAPLPWSATRRFLPALRLASSVRSIRCLQLDGTMDPGKRHGYVILTPTSKLYGNFQLDGK